MWPVEWRDRRAARRRGLTLLEVLMVMAIMAMLLSLVIGLGRHADAAGKRGRAVADMAEWRQALTRWHLAFGEYPEILVAGSVTNLLEVGITTPTTNLVFREVNDVWRQTDPWGGDYRYEGGGQVYRLWSLGPDGRDNTSDDVESNP